MKVKKVFNVRALNKNLGNRGISLPEIMISVVIFLMVVGGIYASVLAGDASWQVNRTRTEMRQELRKSMDGMINFLREAGNSSIVNVPADGNTYNTITFKTPTSVTSSGIVWDTNNTIFQLNSGQLLRTTGGNTRVIANNLSTLGFTRQTTSSDIIEVSLTSTDTAANGVTVVEQLDFEVQLRN